MDKIYQKTTWENSPSTNTPINETNLNNIENGVDELDNRVVRLDQTKSNVDWVQLQQGGKKIAEITIDGVKKNVYAPNGSGGGGGTTDYEDLDNKPSINGVSLVGNKTNSDLGIIIPTTLAELEEDTTHRTVTDAQITKWNQGGSGGGGTAKDTTYDNTTSGLDAENVQDAIDEVKQDLNNYEQTTDEEIEGLKSSLPNKQDKTWTFLGTVKSNAPLTIPSGATEAICVVGSPFYKWSQHIMASANYEYTNAGTVYTNGLTIGNSGVYWQVRNRSISILWGIQDGANNTTNATIDVFYR